MYESYWNLKEKPFQNTPDPRFLYLSSQHEDSLMKLTYVVAQNLGAGMLTGVFGCGKTLLARVILRDLGPQKFCAAYINNPRVTEPGEIIRAVVRLLRPQELPGKKTELLVDPLLEKLNNILLDNINDGKENIVVVDEAHTIDDPGVFEELRLLLNFQSNDRFLLTMILVGQPELREKVDAVKPFAQRIPIRCHLDVIDEKEVARYITHRVEVAADKSANAVGITPVFGQDAIAEITSHTGGIPRRINTLCDLTLLSGFAKKIEKIDGDFIRSVVKEFDVS